MRDTAIGALENLCATESNIFLLTGDLGFKIFDTFKNCYPDRFINVGVAEANMIGVAAGLALSGKNVYCYSIVPFLTMRCLEQIRVDLCYQNVNVKLLGMGGGLHYGVEGMTHHAIEDISILRSLPNMTIAAPGDKLETANIMRESVNHEGPIYIRLGKSSTQVHEVLSGLKLGKGILISEGRDICIIATGTMLYTAKITSDMLKRKGFSVSLISMHTIKPLDVELILDRSSYSKAIFTIEEHGVLGGLGSAVAEVLMESGYKGIFKRIGLPDTYGAYIGHCEYLCGQFGLTPEAITNYILKYITNRE